MSITPGGGGRRRASGVPGIEWGRRECPEGTAGHNPLFPPPLYIGAYLHVVVALSRPDTLPASPNPVSVLEALWTQVGGAGCLPCVGRDGLPSRVPSVLGTGVERTEVPSRDG